MLSPALEVSNQGQRYDGVARFLHWAMALGLLWMLFTALVRFFAGDTPFADAVWPWHRPIGFSLFLLWWLRAAWAFKQRGRKYEPNFAVRWGHRLLYLLMVAVPSIALIRQYGSGRAFEYFGLTVMQAKDTQITWMTDLGGLLHGELGWLLFALMIGHIAMALWHSRDPQTNVLPKMWG